MPSLARYVDKAVNLLPYNGSEVSVGDVKRTLINSYDLDPKLADRVIKEVGLNDYRVQARNHSYDK